MKIIKNPEKFQQQYPLDSFFQTKDLPFFYVQFDKGEELNYQLNPEKYLLFLLQGQLTIRHINEEGVYLEIARIHPLSLLGDMEFVHPGVKQYLIEMEEDSVFAALPLANVREQLKKDPVFLWHLAASIEEKMEKAGFDENMNKNLKARFLIYLEMQKDKKIDHVQTACDDLRCSRRQLQRVLQQLCREGTILKTGKGRYALQ